MTVARRHYLMALRDHLGEDVRDHEDDAHGRRAKFLLDHLPEHMAPIDWQMVEDIEAALRGEDR